jgi:hypothetical protein
MKNDFTYCKGDRCALKEHCVRYVDGLRLPEGSWWWMTDCGTEREGYIDTDSHKK